MNLTLVIPAKNEKESLPLVLNELKIYNFKIKVVLEREDIETINSIKNYNCEIVFQKNNGFGDALNQGINSTETELFCIFNADGSFKPDEINKMISKINEENADFVFATRYEKNCGSDDDTIVTLIGNFVFTFFGNFFFKLGISDILYTFVVGKTSAYQKLDIKSKDFSFCVELPIKAKKAGFRLMTSKSYERSRIAGLKKVNPFKDGLKILISMIKLFFTKLN
tara:strand:- start:4 stop:675 length:672 start_codon:yes stop_codon:yes gene_type:complete